MNWKNLTKSFVLCLALIGMLAAPAIGQTEEPVRKAVYHVDFGNAKRMDATLRNIYNLVNYYTSNGIDYDVCQGQPENVSVVAV